MFYNSMSVSKLSIFQSRWLFHNLTFITLWANSAYDKFSYFFKKKKKKKEKKIDSLHEMSKLISWGKIRKTLQDVSAEILPACETLIQIYVCVFSLSFE